MNNAKKLLALVLAVVMCLALAVPAFAEGDELAADVYTQANFDQVAHDEESGQIPGFIAAWLFRKHNHMRNFKACRKGAIIGIITLAVIAVIFGLLLWAAVA